MDGRELRSSRGLLLLSLMILVSAGSCGVPRYNCGSVDGRAAIVDAVNKSLTEYNCSGAIELIETCYAASNVDDEIRMLRASAHACAANINFFELLTNLASNNLLASGFWMTMAKLFPSSTDDSRTEAAQLATDALMAVLEPGVIVSTSNRINWDTVNPGSLNVSDRKTDANAYLIFVSMAAIGSLQNRYSATDTSTYHKTQVLGYQANPASANTGWAEATNVDVYGCTFAGSILNMIDGINNTADQLTGSIAGTLKTMASAFETLMNAACEAGCNGSYPTGCALAAGTCSTCPTTLRNRNSCTGLTTDENSCAAAGMAHFINTDATNGWP